MFDGGPSRAIVVCDPRTLVAGRANGIGGVAGEAFGDAGTAVPNIAGQAISVRGDVEYF